MADFALNRMTWQQYRNILAFPYAWQTPVKTESWAYQRCLKDLPDTPFAQIVCFPWATLIDLLRSSQTDKARQFLTAINSAPPRMTLIRATICQHIYMKDLIPFFKQLKITDIFWSHATHDEKVIEGMRIHPFPLYPVRCADVVDCAPHRFKQWSHRRYLYSFIGAYEDSLYLTPVRQWLFALPQHSNAIIKRRTEWHYEQHVYGEQISGITLEATQLQQHEHFSQEYVKVLQETKFCLCPSGSGPNSIRLWEALGFGCVPVLMADTLRLPGENQQLWQSAIMSVAELQSAIDDLPKRLSVMTIENKQFEAITLLWERYGLNDFIYDIRRLFEQPNLFLTF
jgi:hypothetical protein